jgi:hypothetical protein
MNWVKSSILTSITALLPYLVNFIVNVISNQISGLKNWNLIIILAIMFAWLAWIWKKNHEEFIEFGSYHQESIKTDVDKQRNSRQGLIVVVPLYTHPKTKDQTDEHNKEINQKIREEAQSGKYESMEFEKSNFGHVVVAITTHASTLKDCWLISTENGNPDIPGSKLFVPALINYLREQRGLECNFHWEDCSVKLDDDPSVTENTKDKLVDIFTHSGTPKNTIADFTGGMRSIALGVFLACLHCKRDLQFIGTHYDLDGRFDGRPYPLITKFSIRK